LEWGIGASPTSWTDLAGLTSSYTATAFTVTTNVVAGQQYAVRVRAYNAHGWGAVSPSTVIAASAAPDQMLPPTTAIQDLVNVRIAWAAADANSDPLLAYEVLIRTSDGTTFAPETASCDGSAAGPRADNRCDIPLTTLRAAPFNLAQGVSVIAKVRARNSLGWGPYSDTTEGTGAARIQVEPHQVAQPTRGSATSVSQIEVVWTALTGDATGGSPVDSYHLQWDAGSGAGGGWYDLQGGPDSASYSLLSSHIVSTGVTAGSSYRFRVMAHNAHGWSAPSAIATLVAASTPGVPGTPVTTIENIYVKIAWTAPPSNSADIDGYDVYVARQDGTFNKETTYCDGFTSSAVRTQAYCLVPMAVLREPGYGLLQGSVVRAYVIAHNVYGYGGQSDVNIAGVAVQTAPAQVQGLIDGPTTSESQVELIWNALSASAETGGAAILSYNVQWDQGLGTGVWSSLVGYSSDFSAQTLTVTSGIQAGTVFKFRVRAKNMWGWGPFSAELSVTPSAVPD
jgi:hypothetical protein